MVKSRIYYPHTTRAFRCRGFFLLVQYAVFSACDDISSRLDSDASRSPFVYFKSALQVLTCTFYRTAIL